MKIEQKGVEGRRSEVTGSLEVESTGRSTLDLLPEEIWIKVFHSLDGLQLLQVRMTCRSWNRIVGNSSSLMEKLELNLPKDIILDEDCEEVKILSSSQNHYSHLVMQQLRIIRVDFWWPSIASNLESLSIIKCQITITTLLAMLEPLHNLKSFTLSSGSLVDARGCPTMINFRLVSLEKLVLQEMNQSDLLDVFRRICPRLKIFEMPTGTCTETHPQKVVQFVKAVKGTLHEVELPMSQRIWDAIMVIDGICLRRVSLTECKERSMEESHIVELSQKYSSIETLQLPSTFENKSSLNTIGRNLTNLKQLKITLENTSFLHQLLELTSLNIIANSFHRCFQTPFNFTGYENCNLTSLSLTSAKISASFLSSFPNIEEFYLLDCNLASWSNVFDPKLRSLRMITLVATSTSNDDDCLAETFENLKFLSITNCHIKKSFLIALFSVSPKLTRVKLTAVSQIDDEVMKVMGRKLKNLQRITVIGCIDVNQLSQTIFRECYPQIDFKPKCEKGELIIRGRSPAMSSISPERYGGYYNYLDDISRLIDTHPQQSEIRW